MMARKPKQLSAYEIAVKDGFTGTAEEWLVSLEAKDEPEATEDELFVGKLTKLRYEPGTMSAPAFMDFTLETAEETVQFEAKGKIAAYISLLNSGERLGVFVRDGKIVGVA